MRFHQDRHHISHDALMADGDFCTIRDMIARERIREAGGHHDIRTVQQQVNEELAAAIARRASKE